MGGVGTLGRGFWGQTGLAGHDRAEQNLGKLEGSASRVSGLQQVCAGSGVLARGTGARAENRPLVSEQEMSPPLHRTSKSSPDPGQLEK